ncbi:PREDICTED: protein REVERSION-TO-ETHYLENE SENSITIVITY1-like [Nelumbo nucifera]|uniref:Protein REVERSION-TO-ETHYLENE SENSITIVITY1-like n=1 Tax=Nelumbo nucifera TaxID=4432 RepID=A0A1U8A6M1_NELNU|nr:PREDICTED: protein REVERSION-TO-ETHYLENE SENSITIVITY1-like [Nelumbo nucifera]XP_010262157.1 PREDICTED: protein REVERSION-TO-ETHYLENE SENSITIVITY1-like [Nelumbo nucifera]XP_010262158.1 PREDICTED: protein REVERSION-TO-ETHYLENE SENSITIVITY1-like [Nelumbo nucifera]
MYTRRFSLMELKETDIEDGASDKVRLHQFWPLNEVDPKNSKFPCCIVWTPLPVVSWLAPFIGHVGICREDGAIIGFAGSNSVNIDSFAYGGPARYLQLDREQCCFPPNLAGHTCKHGYWHVEHGTAITWDDALHSSMHHFENKSFNLFVCNSHSFVANCLNRLCYGGSLGWNMVNVGVLILLKGRWVDWKSVIRSFFPFALVLCLGILMAGWSFLIGFASFSLLLIGWFLLRTYCLKSLIEC